MDDMAQSLQPKERVCSTGYMELSCRLCTKLSYRNATEMINLFQHRDANETIKLRTLSDSSYLNLIHPVNSFLLLFMFLTD